jgi:hypothetical protein
LVPQPPQLLLSLCRLTQALLHKVSGGELGGGHTQAPPEQTAAAGHLVPQAPQLLPSVCRLVHAPLHSI